MNTLHCLIVDDESISRKFLEHYIQQMDFLELVNSCANATDAITSLQKFHIDVVLLDIEMPEKSGLQMLEELDYKPAIILVTAKEQYAVKAYELDVVDYLVKPITYPRLEKAIGKARKFLEVNNRKADAEELFIKVNSRFVKIHYNDILYIEAQGDYIQVHVKDKKYIMYNSMSEMQKRLPDNRFVRVHRSYIINLAYVTGVKQAFVQLSENEIPLGVSYKQKFLSLIKGM
ncbi:MAG: response regulator transcription factor [Ignavibacteriales bacterium]|nr:response regulator transcription factor [Ignavibacteriales bacterium]